MKVRDIMESPARTVRPDTQIGEVARLMLETSGRGLPVVNVSGQIRGVVTERDLVAKHARVHGPVYLGILGGIIPIGTRHTDEEVRRVLAVTASEVMSEDVSTIGPDAEVDDAASLMVEQDADPVLVVDDQGELVGTVSRLDVIRLLVLEEC